MRLTKLLEASIHTNYLFSTQGEHKDCECTAPPYIAVDLASPELQKSIQSLKELLGKGSPAPDTRPECPIVVTDIPAAVFSSEKMNIHSHFCEGWLKDTTKTMTVDSKGANVLPEPHLTAVTKRTPPPDARRYTNFRFDLSFTPSEGGGECKQECNAVFAQFANACAASSCKFLPLKLPILSESSCHPS